MSKLSRWGTQGPERSNDLSRVHRQGRARIQCRDSCNFSPVFSLVMAVKISHIECSVEFLTFQPCFIQTHLSSSYIVYHQTWMISYDIWHMTDLWPCQDQSELFLTSLELLEIVTLRGLLEPKICISLLRAILICLGFRNTRESRTARWSLIWWCCLST